MIRLTLLLRINFQLVFSAVNTVIIYMYNVDLCPTCQCYHNTPLKTKATTDIIIATITGARNDNNKFCANDEENNVHLLE